MKLIVESWRKFINEEKESAPQVVTVDFDDTIRMSRSADDDESESETEPRAYLNQIVVNKIKEFKAQGAKIYIVTSRRSTKDNERFLDDYLDTNDVSHDGIHLTNTHDKWYTIHKLGSNMHFDDDNDEFKAIKNGIEELSDDKPNIKLMKVDWKTGEVEEWKEELEETIEKSGDEYCLKSKKNKNLGCYSSKAGAKKREKQVQYFKHRDKE